MEETSSQSFDYEAHLSDWRYDSENAGMYTWVGSVSGRADGSLVSTSTWSVPEVTFPSNAELATMLSMKQGQTITEADIVAMRAAVESSTTLDAPVVSESLEDWLAEPEDYSTWEVSVFLGVPTSAGPRYADREQRIEEIEDVVFELADDLQLDAEVQPFLSVIGFKAWLTRTEVDDLLADPRVRKLSASMGAPPQPLGPTLNLDEIRQHMQVSEIWSPTSGSVYDLFGNTPSATYPGAPGMVLAVVDTPIDHDHPVFSKPWTSGNRLLHVYRSIEEPEMVPVPPYDDCPNPVLYHPGTAAPYSGAPVTFADVAGTGTEGSAPSSGTKDASEHGTSVLGLAAGSLYWGPTYPVDTIVSDPPYEYNRTGMAPSASLISVEAGLTYECPPAPSGLERRYYSNEFTEEAIDFTASSVPADVALMAFGNTTCDASDSINESANQVFLAGTLPVAAMGNVWTGGGYPCNAASPALAPGTLAVGALESSGAWPYDLRPMWRETTGTSGSSRGGHMPSTRSIVDLVVPGGPWADCYVYDPVACPSPLDGIPIGSVAGAPAGGWGFLPDYHDPTGSKVSDQLGFNNANPSTSWATGIAGGAMLLLREQVQLAFPSGPNEPGLVKAIALGMTDNAVPTDPYDPTNGHLIVGTTAANGAMDDLTGAGRLRMRRWNSEGMDSVEATNPTGKTFAFIPFVQLVDDGGVYILQVNEDASGVNHPMPSDTDTLRAAVFWFEPNYDRTISDQARIDVSLVDVTHGVSTGTPLGYDNKARATRWAPPAGSVYELRLHGVTVPRSKHPDYYHNQRKRLVFGYVFWEDADRDDADGPGITIE